jgi:hypothetical protein
MATISEGAKLILKYFRGIELYDNPFNGRMDTATAHASTIGHGFVFDERIIENHPTIVLDAFINLCIREFLSSEKLSRTFYNNWKEIREKSEAGIHLEEAAAHYLTTYGAQTIGMSGNFMYIPNNTFGIPGEGNLPVIIIKALTKDDIILKCFDVLDTPAGLKPETIEDMLSILESVKYPWTVAKARELKNKEAKALIYHKLNFKPETVEELLRIFMVLATGKAMIIKDPITLHLVRESNISVYPYGVLFGMEKLAESFNRYKKIWMAFKLNGGNNAKFVNKLSKMSKKLHVPMKQDVLNTMTSVLHPKSDIVSALKKVNTFRVVRLANALKDKLNTSLEERVYKIRNGKSFAKSINSWLSDESSNYLKETLSLVENELKSRFAHLYISNQDLFTRMAMPSSEKQFIGHLPAGTQTIINKHTNLVVGIHWHNDGGARDLDLSAITFDGKRIGWGTDYADNGVCYSGDITNAPEGATGFMLFTNVLKDDCMLLVNLYSESDQWNGKSVKFTLFIAHQNSTEFTDAQYLIDPKGIIWGTEVEMTCQEMVLGNISIADHILKFTLNSFNFDGRSVSTNSEPIKMARKHFKESTFLYFDDIMSGIRKDYNNAEVELLPGELDKAAILALMKEGDYLHNL